LDRHFSFAAIAFRIMGHLRSWRCTCGPHPQGGVNAETLRQALQEWITAVGAKTAYIAPGSPWENGRALSPSLSRASGGAMIG
jgi:hypothetical protein